MNYISIIVIALYLILTHVIAHHIGEKREIGYGKSVFWSILLTPIIGFIIAIMSKKLDKN